MKKIALIATLFAASSAFAAAEQPATPTQQQPAALTFADGTYTCLSQSVFTRTAKETSVQVSTANVGGVDLPVLQVVRGDAILAKGIGSILKVKEKTMLVLAAGKHDVYLLIPGANAAPDAAISSSFGACVIK